VLLRTDSFDHRLLRQIPSYFLALQKADELKEPQVINIFTEELLQLHRGQGMEIYWRDNVICPTDEEYMEMISNSMFTFKHLVLKLYANHGCINRNWRSIKACCSNDASCVDLNCVCEPVTSEFICQLGNSHLFLTATTSPSSIFLVFTSKSAMIT
jgi:hypothetical protein